MLLNLWQEIWINDTNVYYVVMFYKTLCSLLVVIGIVCCAWKPFSRGNRLSLNARMMARYYKEAKFSGTSALRKNSLPWNVTALRNHLGVSGWDSYPS